MTLLQLIISRSSESSGVQPSSAFTAIITTSALIAAALDLSTPVTTRAIYY